MWSCDSQATESWKMAQLHVTRVKREFREIVTSEEVGGRVGGWEASAGVTG